MRDDLKDPKKSFCITKLESLISLFAFTNHIKTNNRFQSCGNDQNHIYIGYVAKISNLSLLIWLLLKAWRLFLSLFYFLYDLLSMILCLSNHLFILHWDPCKYSGKLTVKDSAWAFFRSNNFQNIYNFDLNRRSFVFLIKNQTDSLSRKQLSQETSRITFCLTGRLFFSFWDNWLHCLQLLPMSINNKKWKLFCWWICHNKIWILASWLHISHFTSFYFLQNKFPNSCMSNNLLLPYLNFDQR